MGLEGIWPLSRNGAWRVASDVAFSEERKGVTLDNVVGPDGGWRADGRL